MRKFKAEKHPDTDLQGQILEVMRDAAEYLYACDEVSSRIEYETHTRMAFDYILHGSLYAHVWNHTPMENTLWAETTYDETFFCSHKGNIIPKVVQQYKRDLDRIQIRMVECQVIPAAPHTVEPIHRPGPSAVETEIGIRIMQPFASFQGLHTYNQEKKRWAEWLDEKHAQLTLRPHVCMELPGRTLAPEPWTSPTKETLDKLWEITKEWEH